MTKLRDMHAALVVDGVRTRVRTLTLRTSLAGSLALNVALAGYIAISFAKVSSAPGVVWPIPEVFGTTNGQLSPADVAIIRDAYRTAAPEILAKQTEVMHSAARTIVSVASPKFEVDAVRDAVTDARKKRAQFDELVAETFLSALEHISADVRRRLVAQYRLRGS